MVRRDGGGWKIEVEYTVYTWRVYGILKILHSAHVSNASRREHTTPIKASYITCTHCKATSVWCLYRPICPDSLCPTNFYCCSQFFTFWSKILHRLLQPLIKLNMHFMHGVFYSSSSSRMRVINHNWSATKQRLHPQSVFIRDKPPLVLSGDRIRQCETSSGSRDKDADQCL